MKVILGIDPGLASTGFGVIHCSGNRFRCITHGTVRTSPRDGIGERLVQIHQEIMDIITTYAPEEAGIETVYFSKNSKSAIPVAQARGVVLYTLASRGVPFAEYTPLELKQAVVGRGRAEKIQVQQVLKMIFRLEQLPTPDHAADALAAAFCHANFSGFQSHLAGSRKKHV
jgi:crossover junction endodeoxyribonuclease RuvC